MRGMLGLTGPDARGGLGRGEARATTARGGVLDEDVLRERRRYALLLLLLPAEHGSRAATPATTAAATTAAAGTVTVVQAVPDHTVEVRVDGKNVGAPVGVGELVGPLRLPAGSHEVTFRDASGAARRDLHAGGRGGVDQRRRPAPPGGGRRSSRW